MRQSIYIMQNGKDFKIGISVNPEKRLAGIRCGSPKTELIWYSEPIEHASRVENRMHKKYKDCRVGGEWFRLKDVDEVINTISQYASECKEENREKVGQTTCENSDTTEKTRNDMENAVAFALGFKNNDELVKYMEKLESETLLLKTENALITEFSHFITSCGRGNSVIANTVFENVLWTTINILRKKYEIDENAQLLNYLTQDEYDKAWAVFDLVIFMIKANFPMDEIIRNIKAVGGMRK